ncbi:MAG: SprT family zinc-dependent metalloprotease [Pseudomonadota bacterium]|nr:SprT family zinc-dependent metalloprotease [Pseudomonadota bacterium]MDP1904343.1 SprT family zinc-dependent metalloprotease [Pseudomonadota bacterium]MDP2353470.1 SprT family zinc-dependent metalloprotease [Pseudomonadota bacterium]
MKIRTEEVRALSIRSPGMPPSGVQPSVGEAAPLSYALRRSARRRSLALRVNEAGEVVVNAPMRLAQREIDTFLARHHAWLIERVAAAREHAFQWRDGAALPWLGNALSLRLLAAAGKPAIRREAEQLVCHAAPPALAALVSRWYQREARILLGERLAHHAARAGLAMPPLRLSNARTRWGSLSARGVVSLNWRLLKAPLTQIDYVICHELAHFKQRNHSPAFWREVEALFPDWKKVRAELRQNGRLYFQF